MVGFIVGSLGGGEIIVLLILAMVVVGPERLPQTGRQIGHFIAKARRQLQDLTSQVSDVMEDPAMESLRELTEFAVRPRQKLAEFIREAEDAMNSVDQSQAVEEMKRKSAPGPEAWSPSPVDEATAVVEDTGGPGLQLGTKPERSEPPSPDDQPDQDSSEEEE